MTEQLKKIAVSYDRGIDLGRKGIDSYNNLPEEIVNHPNYNLFIQMRNEEELSDSAGKEIYDFLDPGEHKKFVDLGCCLNLMFRGYDQWKSLYYGVDISPKTIELLNEYSTKNNIRIGSLYCGSMHQTPFEENFFDIGCCIGSLEYFEKCFVKECIQEMRRIIKKSGRLVLDIPNVGTKEFDITALIEKSLGREDLFNFEVVDFEQFIRPYFDIHKKKIVGPMIQYYLVSV